jgi:hypothetical protein
MPNATIEKISKTNIWYWVLMPILIFHGITIAYDLFDIAGVDSSYYARVFTLILYTVLFGLAIRFGLIWAIAYCVLTALCVTMYFTKQPDSELLQIAAKAFYPLNMVFSGILLTAILALRKQKQS